VVHGSFIASMIRMVWPCVTIAAHLDEGRVAGLRRQVGGAHHRDFRRRRGGLPEVRARALRPAGRRPEAWADAGGRPPPHRLQQALRPGAAASWHRLGPTSAARPAHARRPLALEPRSRPEPVSSSSPASSRMRPLFGAAFAFRIFCHCLRPQSRSPSWQPCSPYRAALPVSRSATGLDGASLVAFGSEPANEALRRRGRRRSGGGSSPRRRRWRGAARSTGFFRPH